MTVEWCGCAHDREDHAAGYGNCAGEMVFDSGDGQGGLTVPCACEGFKFWYSDEEGDHDES